MAALDQPRILRHAVRAHRPLLVLQHQRDHRCRHAELLRGLLGDAVELRVAIARGQPHLVEPVQPDLFRALLVDLAQRGGRRRRAGRRRGPVRRLRRGQHLLHRAPDRIGRRRAGEQGRDPQLSAQAQRRVAQRAEGRDRHHRRVLLRRQLADLLDQLEPVGSRERQLGDGQGRRTGQLDEGQRLTRAAHYLDLEPFGRGDVPVDLRLSGVRLCDERVSGHFR